MDFLSPEDFSEEELQQLMELGIIPEQQDALSQQLRQANSVRNRPGPEGRSDGRVYTAAHPLEHLVHGIQGYKANQEAKSIQQQQMDMLRKQAEGRGTFFKGMRRRTGAPIETEEYDQYLASLQAPQGSF